MKLHPHMTSEHVRNALESDQGRYTTLLLAYGEISRAIHLVVLRGDVPGPAERDMLSYAADGTYAALHHHTNSPTAYIPDVDQSRVQAWRHLNSLCEVIKPYAHLFADTLCVPTPEPGTALHAALLEASRKDRANRLLKSWVVRAFAPPSRVVDVPIAEVRPEDERGFATPAEKQSIADPPCYLLAGSKTTHGYCTDPACPGDCNTYDDCQRAMNVGCPSGMDEG